MSRGTRVFFARFFSAKKTRVLRDPNRENARSAFEQVDFSRSEKSLTKSQVDFSIEKSTKNQTLAAPVFFKKGKNLKKAKITGASL